jgi:flagellar biosynthetic protein FlhB
VAEDKQFEATSQRLARAKREGDLPRSADLNALASLASAALAASAAVPLLSSAAATALQRASRGDLGAGPYVLLGGCGLGVCVAGLCGALLATYLQSRTFTFKFPAPNIAKLNPMAGIKKMVSRDAVLAAAKAVVVTAALVATLLPGLRDAFGASAVAASPLELAAQSWHTLQIAFGGALVIATFFAVADVLLERTKWKRRLRMSFDEVKRDMKSSEGDPHVKGKRRQMQRALVRGSVARVKDAAFVVTNPTHIAIALAYDPPEVPVPRVLVRAVDAGAQEVKRLARELRVPIIENVPLARALLGATDVGEYIPPSAYAAVAAIVAALVREKAIVT